MARKPTTPAPAALPTLNTLDEIITGFKARYPAEWEALRLCPLQHGLEDMIRILKG